MCIYTICLSFTFTVLKLYSFMTNLLSSPFPSSVKQGVKYQYMVQVETDGLLSDVSPPLLYTHGQPYCGDGRIHGSVLLYCSMCFG